MNNRGNLRVEKSKACSLVNEYAISLLKEDEYLVKNYELDGDAPKQFIKAYFYEEGSTVRKSSSSSWHSYIAKTAEKWYPHESVIEYMINRIGQVLGLNMNDIRLVRANGQIRFLSKYFLKKNDKLIHGAEICGEHLGDQLMAQEIANNKTTSRELFTFEFIKDSIRSVFPESFDNLLVELVKMITFDALVGNNDRHFYNWGVIDTKKKTSKLPTFAPIYDSARGLLWNLNDENIKHFLNVHKNGGKKVVNYIEEASPRISIEGNTQANHFQLINFLKKYNSEYPEIVNELANAENEENVLKMLRSEFFPLFISQRSEIITLILETRFKKIRGI
ncbi:HipA-like C-terminal domain-containing protein [Hydrobacter penzbergensis]|uniref:HipA-like C-terminal domain-containing protein n=1 Tax=Hydrobacter penzbergensis TaxID=1235997 RepID=A0A8X8IF27_9BACT|nr:HipA domain-containing protein [Hydrobacter penzbergensis]SDW84979.1 HipA-like C-terminal domain-containing protein [Hydrobacter penzbergensis]